MENHLRWGLIYIILIISAALSSCGGGGGSSGNTEQSGTGNPTTTVVMPQLNWSFSQNVKNPVTDLGSCAESVMTCVKNGVSLRDCIGSDVNICQSKTPSGGCCTQTCRDQLTDVLDSGKNDQDAFLEVFVFDGSCMPGITKQGATP